MKVYTCKCMPNGLEFACVVVAEDEEQARLLAKAEAEKDGWTVTAEEVQLEELDTTQAGARIIDPINDYKEVNE